MQKGFSSVRVLACCACTSLLRSIPRFSMMFRSGDCEDHGKTFSLCPMRSPIVEFEVCLGSSFIFSFFIDNEMFSPRSGCYLIESFLPSTSEMFLVPLAATHARSMIEEVVYFISLQNLFAKCTRLV